MTSTVGLRAAEGIALQLFEAARPFVTAGTAESELNERVRQLAKDRFAIDTFWHKRIVRSGPNTTSPYAENPPDRVIEANDIVFFDFGPVLQDWEADLGRTYVVGHDPEMHRIVKDIEECWALAKAHYDASPDITGAELFAFVKELCEGRGWEYRIDHAGHLVGEFPHERIRGDSRSQYIHPDNDHRLHGGDPQGRRQDWILELHFADPGRRFGAFFEQLLGA